MVQAYFRTKNRRRGAKMNIYKIIALILFVAFSYNTFAQSKPKRDTSKDRSALIGKKTHTRKKSNYSYQTRRTSTKQQKAIINRSNCTHLAPQKASYLLVNQQTEVNRTVSSTTCSETFNVKTDGKSWEIINTSHWCHFLKKHNSFVLTCEENPYFENRKCSFTIKCDEKVVKLNITQLKALLNAHGVFSNVKLQHNKKLDKTAKSLVIDAALSISLTSPKKATFRVYAFFYDSSGQSIAAKNEYSYYSMPLSKDVTASTTIYQNNSFSTHQFQLSIPNNAFRLWKKKHRIKCVLLLYSIDTKELIRSTRYEVYFKVKNKNGKIKTYEEK